MDMQMNQIELNWEAQLQKAAAAFPYPPTPAIHARIAESHTRAGKMPALPVSHSPISNLPRFALITLLLFLLLATLLAVPTTRAAIARFLRIGAITISVGEAEPEQARAPVATDQPATRPALAPPAVPDSALSTPAPRPTSTPAATPTPDLEGPLTLRQAEEAVGFTLLLPGPSITLGSPDEIYVQLAGPPDTPLAAVLIWSNPQGGDSPRLALFQIGVPDYGLKAASLNSVVQTEVNGRQAYWIEGEHLLQAPGGDGNMTTRLVGSVLVWTDGAQTYRLEGAPSVTAAVDIAESLGPAPSPNR